MNKFKKTIISLVLAALLISLAILGPAQAVDLSKSAEISQKRLTLLESSDGKLVNASNPVAKPHKIVNAVLTAYSSTPDQTDDDPFIAASGKRVYDGMVAANWLPFGTKIKIPALFGDKIFTVDDRMNARYGYGRMDIWMNAPRKQVNAFGVKRTKIEVYLVESPVKVAKADRI